MDLREDLSEHQAQSMLLHINQLDEIRYHIDDLDSLIQQDP